MPQQLFNFGYFDELEAAELPENLKKQLRSLRAWLSQANNPGAIVHKEAELDADEVIKDFTKAFLTKAAQKTESMEKAVDMYIDFMTQLFMKKAEGLKMPKLDGAATTEPIKPPDTVAGKPPDASKASAEHIKGQAQHGKSRKLLFDRRTSYPQLKTPVVPKQNLVSPGPLPGLNLSEELLKRIKEGAT